MRPVFCRIGSSEIVNDKAYLCLGVFCRIGSSENYDADNGGDIVGLLPYRQLRKEYGQSVRPSGCLLPYRQLRNCKPRRTGQGKCLLPYRQLRNLN